MKTTALRAFPDLLLMQGGPTYRFEVRLGLVREAAPHIVRRALLAVLVTWVPLLLLTIARGTAIGHNVPIPFLRDIAVNARFLFAVPLLLLAEAILGPHLAEAARHFVETGLVPEEEYPAFDAAVEKALRARDSTAVEVALVFLAYATTVMSLKSLALHVSTWYAVRTDSGFSLSPAGWWLIVLSVPFFQFLTMRWLWRLFLWAQFLWRLNHLHLRVVSTHPDQAGGLAFVGEVQRFFAMILLAYSSGVAGVLANEIIYDQVPLTHFGPAIAVYVLLAVAIVMSPLVVFLPTLLKTKRWGLYQYGALASEYTLAFQQKWITNPRQPEDELLGTGDIQSLADLGNSYSAVEKLNALPTRPRTPIHLALACVLPMVPLLLTMMPLGAMLKLIFKVVV